MRKFKLIKWYPSLLRHFTEGIEVSWYDKNGIDSHMDGYNMFDYAYINKGLPKSEVENNPEFWEEIVENKIVYPRIFAFKNKFDNTTFHMFKNGKFGVFEGVYGLIAMLKGFTSVEDGSIVIYKVDKSETEIFTVGDEVIYIGKSESKFPTKPFIIDNFYLKSSGIILVRSKDNLMVEEITTVEKYKTVIEEEKTYAILERDSKNKISSVKRLSDNEIFSIGDDITFRGLYGAKWENSSTKITGFDYRVNKVDTIGALYCNGLVDLKKIKKVDINKTYEAISWFDYKLSNIKSVKRMSDDEIFSVGDEIIYCVNNKNEQQKITNIIEKEKVIWLYVIKSDFLEISVKLEYVTKPSKNKPLLVTEDGVELFDVNDKVYMVYSLDNFSITHVTVGYFNRSIKDREWCNYCMVFSTEKEAKLFSLNQQIEKLTEEYEQLKK